MSESATNLSTLDEQAPGLVLFEQSLGSEPTSGSLASMARPRRLADVVGQRHVTTVLQKALATDRVPHQLLFSGGSGLGKTTLARVLSMALLCENPSEDHDACGVCDTCLDIWSPHRSHPDVVEFDAASHGLKEQVKELAARAQTAPIRSRFRIYIIDEAHGLSTSGGQAFLKLLEEPPPHVIFMLATTDPQKMLKTNRSRCVEFELTRPTTDDLVNHLCAMASSLKATLPRELALEVVTSADDSLGVRGLVMSLEKLMPYLAEGTLPDDLELATLLHIAPRKLLNRIMASVNASDRPALLEALDEGLHAVGSSALRRSVLAALKEALEDALRSKNPAEVLLWRLDLLAQAPDDPLYLELALLKMASPYQVSPPPLEALVAEAQERAEQLTVLLHEAAALPTRSSTSLPNPQPVQDASTTTGEPDAVSDEPATSADALTFEDLCAAAQSRRLAALLRGSKAHLEPGVLVVPAAAHERLLAAGLAELLEQHSLQLSTPA